MNRHVADLEGNPDATARDLLGLFGRVGRLTRGMAGVRRGLADYGLTRNEALLEQEMGLGEYTWIYVIVYYGWLAREPTSFALADS